MSDPGDIQHWEQLPPAGKWIAAVLFWGGTIIGGIAITWMAFDPTSGLASEFTPTFAFLTVLTVSVLLHELGHLFAGGAAGLRPVLLKLGFGGTLFELHLKKITLAAGIIPFAGRLTTLPLPKPARRASAVFISGGPLANALLLVFAVIAIKSRGVDGRRWIDFVLFYAVVANGILLATSLFPWSGFMDGVPFWSDGKHLLELFLAPRTVGASDSAESKTSTAFDHDPFRGWNQNVTYVPADTFLAIHRFMLNNPDGSPHPRPYLLDAFATGVLMYGQTPALPEADSYSRELLDARPDEWTTKGTRGSVLIELGEIESGYTMLLSVFENSPSQLDKAISAAYLGLAELKRGNRLQGSEWCRSAAAIHPNFPILKRLQRLLQERER